MQQHPHPALATQWCLGRHRRRSRARKRTTAVQPQPQPQLPRRGRAAPPRPPRGPPLRPVRRRRRRRRHRCLPLLLLPHLRPRLRLRLCPWTPRPARPCWWCAASWRRAAASAASTARRSSSRAPLHRPRCRSPSHPRLLVRAPPAGRPARSPARLPSMAALVVAALAVLWRQAGRLGPRRGQHQQPANERVRAWRCVVLCCRARLGQAVSVPCRSCRRRRGRRPGPGRRRQPQPVFAPADHQVGRRADARGPPAGGGPRRCVQVRRCGRACRARACACGCGKGVFGEAGT